MTLIVALIIFVAYLVGVICGALVQHHRSIDYKKRWREALMTLEAAYEGKKPESKGLPPAKPKQGELPGVDLKLIHGLPSYDRRDMEVARAKKGLPPVDDLKGLPGWCVNEIVMARIKYGTGR